MRSIGAAAPMPRRRHVAALALALAVLAVLAGTARTARAQAAHPPGRTPAKANAPAAAPPTRAPARFSAKDGACKDFLALPPDLRGMVVAWTAGRYHRLDQWVLDEAIAHKVVAGVERECEKAPDASFRYKVIGEVEKLRKK